MPFTPYNIKHNPSWSFDIVFVQIPVTLASCAVCMWWFKERRKRSKRKKQKLVVGPSRSKNNLRRHLTAFKIFFSGGHTLVRTSGGLKRKSWKWHWSQTFNDNRQLSPQKFLRLLAPTHYARVTRLYPVFLVRVWLRETIWTLRRLRNECRRTLWIRKEVLGWILIAACKVSKWTSVSYPSKLGSAQKLRLQARSCHKFLVSSSIHWIKWRTTH